MITNKYIVKHSSSLSLYVNGFIITDSYSPSLSLFKELYEEVKKDFPNIDEGGIECLKVIKSGWCQGCVMVHFYIGETLYNDQGITVKNGYTTVWDKMPDVIWK